MLYINDIFEYIREQIHCDFISDMKYGSYKVSAIIILRRIDKSQINPKQFIDICRYLEINL